MDSLSDLDTAIQGLLDALTAEETGLAKVEADLVALEAKLAAAGQPDFAKEVASIQQATASLNADLAAATAADAQANPPAPEAPAS